MIKYVVKDLVAAAEEGKNIAFATTADFAMGSGVAKRIDKALGGVKMKLKNLYSSYYPAEGDTYSYKNDEMTVFCLIDKFSKYDSVSTSNLKICFENLKSQMLALGINEIYIPKIACGADNLLWTIDVLPILTEVFEKFPADIYVCVKSEDDIPSDDTFDMDEDSAAGYIDVADIDIVSYDDISNTMIISHDTFDEFVDGAICKFRLIDRNPTAVEEYKMVIDAPAGFIFVKVN